MKLLGFRDAIPMEVPAADPGRDARASLLREDPDAYARLIDHLTRGVPQLRDWAARLKAGDAVVVLTGQQPALLGGPLYTLYKTLTALAVARRMRARGVPAIAAFWCVGDDTDFGEVSAASWPVRGGPPRRVRDEMPANARRLALLGSKRMRPALQQMRDDWPTATIVDDVARFVESNWSGFLKHSLRFLAGDEPFLFIDGNDLQVVRSAQPWLRRFTDRRAGIADQIARLARVEAEAGRAPAITGEEGRHALFVADHGTRRVLGEDEAPAPSDLLLPNVVLRPALQEHLLPVGRVVCGEGEIAYRALLCPVFEMLGRPAAPLMNRFSATLFPPSWLRLDDRPGATDVLERTDETLDAWGRRNIPEDLTVRLGDVRARIADLLRELEEPLAGFDRSLPQVLASAAGKVDSQMERIEESVAGKGRVALYRSSPELAHLREFLLPRGRLQERSLVLWTPFLYEGIGALRDLDQAIDAWFARGETGHALLGLEEPTGAAPGAGEARQ